jgi:hypothetical protein
MVKSSRRLMDTASTPQALLHVLRTTGAGGSRLARGRHTAAVLRSGRAGARSLIELRCERGAAVARAIGLDEVAARAIMDVDEHWDGGGYPVGISGDRISLAGRVLCLAQTAEVFWQHGAPSAACEIARKRRRTWFDPTLVDALVGLEGDARFWRSLETPTVTDVEPTEHARRCVARRCCTTSGSSGCRTESSTSPVRWARRSGTRSVAIPNGRWRYSPASACSRPSPGLPALIMNGWTGAGTTAG